ncbi:MAG TPA: helix-turn-helix domain-containing protein, partial [Aquaticitalea sp.]|nr:helix-turn-helix domain-containing protein [Aquaticitalea sp.]
EHQSTWKNKLPTHLQSYELFKQGKSIPDISIARGFKEDTIYGHLIKMHEEGETIDLYQFISSKEIETIRKAKEELGNVEGLKQLHLYFEEQIPYWKLRLGVYLGN